MERNITNQIIAMIRRIFVVVALVVLSLQASFAQKASELKYTDAQEFALLINQGYDNTEMTYSRLPADMKDQIRKAVWDLGLNSAGLAIRFSSNAKCMGAQWTLLNNFHMNHMPGTGIRGIDLYTLEKGEWRFVGTVQPNGKESRNIFFRNGDGSQREYLAYLPLYDGVVKLEIGVDSTATVSAPKVEKFTSRKPILFYGTSITQGGCASRPGMIYTSILGRWFDCQTINLGFSGNARMDKSMVEAIKRVDAEKYVIDCLPNCTQQIIRDSGYYFISTLAASRPDVTIYMVENINFPDRLVNKRTDNDLVEKNQLWGELYKRLRKEGYKNIRYIPADGLVGEDDEHSVDAAHLTDLGFLRMAEGLKKHLKR